MNHATPHGQERTDRSAVFTATVVRRVVAHFVEALPIQPDDHAAALVHVLVDGTGKGKRRPLLRERTVKSARVVDGSAERDEALDVGAKVDEDVLVPDQVRPFTLRRPAGAREAKHGPAKPFALGR